MKIIHMDIPWDSVSGDDTPSTEASLADKSSLVGRIGMMMLTVGTGAWRIRDSMNVVARSLGISCSADVGLLTIDYTCFDGRTHTTHTLSLHSSGVNTDKLSDLERFIKDFPQKASKYTVRDLHKELDVIQKKKGNHSPLKVGLASAMACCAFTFLLGGGPAEMACAFVGAGMGNYIRRKMLDREIMLFACVMVSVAISCIAYVISIKLAENLWNVSDMHQAGYICAMLFVIPGFPLITGGIDLSKLDMRSGLERLSYALLIILVATAVGWAVALMFNFEPDDFVPLAMNETLMCLLRLTASFIGVFGFSIMFNSTHKMAATAAMVGMIANTLRLELVSLAGLPIGLAAFIGALTAGFIASVINKKEGYPRISITVPSIVIMVPGLYMYRGIYNIALSDFSEGGIWLAKAALIVIALPFGLVVARLLTDKDFRHTS